MAIPGLTASPASGSAGTTSVAVSGSANTGRNSRTGAIALTSNEGGKSATVAVTQSGQEISFFPTAYKVNAGSWVPIAGVSDFSAVSSTVYSIDVGSVSNGASETNYIYVKGRTNSSSTPKLIFDSATSIGASIDASKGSGNSVTANGTQITLGTSTASVAIPGDPGATGEVELIFAFYIYMNEYAARTVTVGFDKLYSSGHVDIVFSVNQAAGYSLSVSKTSLTLNADGGAASTDSNKFNVTSVGTGWTATAQ
jgi:hypothetical protein